MNFYVSFVFVKNFIKEKNGERYYVKVLKFVIWKLINVKCIIFKNLEEDFIKILRKYLMNVVIKIIKYLCSLLFSSIYVILV